MYAGRWMTWLKSQPDGLYGCQAYYGMAMIHRQLRKLITDRNALAGRSSSRHQSQALCGNSSFPVDIARNQLLVLATPKAQLNNDKNIWCPTLFHSFLNILPLIAQAIVNQVNCLVRRILFLAMSFSFLSLTSPCSP